MKVINWEQVFTTIRTSDPNLDGEDDCTKQKLHKKKNAPTSLRFTTKGVYSIPFQKNMFFFKNNVEGYEADIG